ncbi:unnamed protein product [Thlaspi arvense]|uniref:Uncharacterized protein n=1 Tax=Thlaspi arvense TaxID=13288 RepID=A0AAU9R840_THLAR|nr:unnamed protein product [Thlaspi arvense]
MDFVDSETQSPEDFPHREAYYNTPPALAPECKSFKWKIQVIDTDGNIEGKMTTSKDVWKLETTKVIVQCDGDSGQPIGDSGGLLGSWLGQLSNDVNLLPINYSDWRVEALRELLSKNPQVTSNVPASLDDEYAQVFGPERSGRVRCIGRGPTPSKLLRRSVVRVAEIENSETIVELKAEVKGLGDQVKAMSTFIQQILGTSTSKQATAWALSFAAPFAHIQNPGFANIPVVPNLLGMDERVRVPTYPNSYELKPC